MPDSDPDGIGLEAKGFQDLGEEQTVLHAVATPTTSITDDLLEEMLRFKGDGVVRRVVKGEVLVRDGRQLAS